MEIERFDAITSGFAGRSTRRDALRGLAAVAFGVGSLAFLGGDEIAAKKKRKKKKGGSHHGGGSSGASAGTAGSGSRNDRCGGPVGICNADPIPCGTTAEGKICG